MTINIQKFRQVAETAKSRTNDRRWQAAIDKAVAGVESGWWVISELADCVAVTTETGKTYFSNGVCQCEAFKQGQACKHRALYRLLAIYHEAEKETAPAPAVSTASTTSCGQTAAGELKKAQDVVVRAPRIVRSVERDRTGARYPVTYCDGWAI